jgi:hypothetical protein
MLATLALILALFSHSTKKGGEHTLVGYSWLRMKYERFYHSTQRRVTPQLKQADEDNLHLRLGFSM